MIEGRDRHAVIAEFVKTGAMTPDGGTKDLDELLAIAVVQPVGHEGVSRLPASAKPIDPLLRQHRID